MTENHIIYLLDVCRLSYDEIALKTGLTAEEVRAIVSKPSPYPLQYTPRNRYSGWVNGK